MGTVTLEQTAWANDPKLQVVYPPVDHQTRSDRIFFHWHRRPQPAGFDERQAD